MTDAEIDESAKYFAQQKLRRRVYVIESLRIPRAERAAWIYEEVGGTEDLDDRLLEVTNELARHERRDDRLEYIGVCAARQHQSRQAAGRHGRWWQDAALRHLPSRESQGHRQGSADRRPLAYLPAAADAGIPQRHAHATTPRRR